LACSTSCDHPWPIAAKLGYKQNMRIITFDEAFMFWLLNETSCQVLENFLPIVSKFDKLQNRG
jgi:hypothetical protein